MKLDDPASDKRINFVGRHFLGPFDGFFFARDFFTTLCCGPAFATCFMKRSKRGHASGTNSISSGGFFAMAEPIQVPETDAPLYEAIGRFVTSFANAEAAVHILARHFSGLSDEKARIIFGGMRLPDISDLIRHIAALDNLDPETVEAIDSCLTQLSLIAKRRHILVHRSSIFYEGTFLATNVLTTKSLKATEGDTFDLQELSDMQSDCRRVYLRLGRLCSPATHPAEDDPLTEALIYKSAWRYKHAPPKTPNLKPRAKSAKPAPQPPASDGRPEGQE